MEENKKISDVSYLRKLSTCQNHSLCTRKWSGINKFLSTEVTVTFALVTLLDFTFPRIEVICLTILPPPNP